MIKKMLIGTLASALAASVFLSSGCGDAENAGTPNAPVKNAITLNGAGASFPAPVYQLWTYAYTQSGKATVNYQSLGSGAGLSQIKAGTVDFAGTDSPLTAEQQAETGLVQFPMLTGGVVVIVNVPGVKSGELKLSRAVLSDIFLGRITNWNDPAIAKINPGVRLPKDLKITVVRRSDSSGTTFIFTDYLSKISGEWKNAIGAGSSVKWPVGIGGQKNPGVCNNVAKIRGSIGYTEYTYAVEAKLNCVQLENRAGTFIAPTAKSFAASAANADWKNAPGFLMMLTDQPGAESWPITGVTYILIRKDADAGTQAALKDYFNWCFTEGASSAARLNYVPIPENVVSLIREKLQ
ncbi:MAG: phosphate ABC transporter substrate-binding protein PstS [Verrucomicrobia bacterium]|nr:phosphate ABC transporter substrate-binding protein PstS [Verrucomicrobiota bacterium]